MAKQVSKRFAWVIKDFSSLQCDKCYSVPVMIGDCKWRLCAFPKGRNDNYLCLYLDVVDFDSLPSGWRRYVKFRLNIVKQVVGEQSVIKETHGWYDQKHLGWGFSDMLDLTKLHDEKERFLVNGELMIVADVEVLQVIGTSEEPEEAYEPLTKMKKLDDGAEFSDSLNQTQQVKESIEVNGFQVLPSQVEYVSRVFERHPDMAVEFLARNLHLRKICMNFLLGLIETMCQSLEELSNEDLVESDIALTYLRNAGFKVHWLEKKLDILKEKKEEEQSGLARIHEIEENLTILERKRAELDALADEEHKELKATRSALSFDDIVC
ncbi:PREDICTED: MATH domain and coiled-coil domain-containing protein At3g58410-like [Camelina sativa]|uniref:MATH domain and coiled-coil domain-containing protein At3g58410-like n=1 Tax=Camelina sativa TaxID=90675 RepID=A0ABM0YXM4_CAMSA|nr:PREDICTED: MATH domain and coiled-coil domain-containing protein At3g58410-like [Camelina sativa]